jgi:hypothetical protein
MKVIVNGSRAGHPKIEEGDLFIDRDGDVNLVVAAGHLDGVRDEDLVVCCIRENMAWIRGPVGKVELSQMTRLASGDSVTLAVD